MKIGFAFLLFLFSYIPPSQGFEDTKLNFYLENLQINNKAMVSAAIVQGGKPIYEKATGFIDVTTKAKANENSQYRIGSITKIFTSTIIFQLIDERKISLNTKLSKFFPKVKNAEKITVSMLLNHSSGIQNFTHLPAYAQYKKKPKTKHEMIEIFESLESDFIPGSSSKYSNTGYILLGFIIEEITSDSYSNQLDTRIVDKLNLSRTSYGANIKTHENKAKSYRYENGTWYPNTSSEIGVAHGAGAIISTPKDVGVFLTSLFSGKLVSSNSLEKMKEINLGFGRGLFEFKFNDKKAYGHNGRIDAFVTQATYYEDDQTAIVLFSNGLNYNLSEIRTGFSSIYYNIPFDIPDLSQQEIYLTRTDLLKYEGTFTSQELPFKINLKVDGTKITAQATGQRVLNLTSFSKREFRFEPAGIRILFNMIDEDLDYTKFTLFQRGKEFDFEK